MDVTLILDMECVLKACAKASRLEHKRALQSHYMRMLPLECKGEEQRSTFEIGSCFADSAYSYSSALLVTALARWNGAVSYVVACDCPCSLKWCW